MKVVITGVTGAVGPFVVADLEKGRGSTLFARRAVETNHANTRGYEHPE